VMDRRMRASATSGEDLGRLHGQNFVSFADAWRTSIVRGQAAAGRACLVWGTALGA